MLLQEKDLIQIERTHPDGLTSAQIIGIFQARGARLSEATFRKYVQLGLLPRCRRVGFSVVANRFGLRLARRWALFPVARHRACLV